MRGLVTWLLLVMSCIAMSGKQSEIEWIEKDYDYGIIDEDAGKQGGQSRFVNRGAKNLSILEVVPGCGCTEVEFPNEKLIPGDTAVISYSFNPKGRPGKFEKAIKVYTSESEGAERIILKGIVAASEETLNNRYPFNSGDLRIESISLPAGELKKGMRRHLYLNLYNSGEKTIKPVWIADKEFLDVKTEPAELGPKEGGSLCLLLDTVKADETGRLEIELTGKSSTESDDSIKVTVYVNIIE